jgi:hypothetical protein
MSVRVPAATLAAVTLAACAPVLPRYTLHAPPQLADVRPPRSVVFFQSEISLAPLRSALEQTLPAELADRRPLKLGPLRAELHYHFERAPVEVRVTNSSLAVDVTFAGPVEISGGSLHCHVDEARVRLRGAATPALDADGTLRFVIERLLPEPQGPFVCGGIALPVGATLEAILAPLSTLITRGLRELPLPLGPLVGLGLHELAKPRAIDLPEHTHLCLDLQPESLVLAPLEQGSSESDLRLRVGVDVAPRLTVGDCPPTRPMNRNPRVLVRTVALGEQFTVEAAVAIPYYELRARLAPLILGKRFGESRHALTVERLELGDAEGRVLAQVTVRGALRGTLYLWGTPRVRERDGRLMLEVPDLDVAVETRSALERLKLGLWQLAGGNLPALLRRTLTLDVTDQVRGLERALSRSRVLTTEPRRLVLTTELRRIEPGRARSIPGALVAYPLLVGMATLSSPEEVEHAHRGKHDDDRTDQADHAQAARGHARSGGLAVGGIEALRERHRAPEPCVCARVVGPIDLGLAVERSRRVEPACSGGAIEKRPVRSFVMPLIL